MIQLASCTPILQSCCAFVITSFVNTASYFDRISNVVSPYFKLGTGIGLCAQGLNETCNPFFSNRSNVKTPLNSCHKIELPSNNYQQVHGVALIGSGILTSVDYSFVDRATPLFASIGRAANILFIYASLLSLEENIRIYNQAKNLEDKTAAHQLRCSAVLGIINTLGYIASGVLLVLGLSTTLALVIGIIAAFTGGLKVLYDLYRWSKEHSIHIDGLPN